ncbi:hypothetical protein JNB62_05130 [Microbacterium jejuense]|uniref:Uncharacterized protein n=1 Tax=Microbacterium jejuense TaxID=1263637 RepID=A0ABS7HK37_9MICO|nr:hypothetical protein [Microbacterium jejuense]MBW9093058.1 hypothetical protein [Microbacterium jejuense]
MTSIDLLGGPMARRERDRQRRVGTRRGPRVQGEQSSPSGASGVERADAATVTEPRAAGTAGTVIRKWWKPAAAAAGALVVAAVSGVVGSFLGVASERNEWPYSPPAEPTAQELAAELDGRFPSSECKANYATVFSAPIGDSAQPPIATVELRKGTDCAASWVWVSSFVADVVITKTLIRKEQGDLPAATVEESDPINTVSGPGRESFTEQLYSPACVSLEVSVYDAAGDALGALPRTEVCATP